MKRHHGPWEILAALACLLPVAASLTHSGIPSEETEGNDLVLAWISYLISLPLACAAIAALPIAMYFFVRSVEPAPAKAAGTLSSVAIGLWYAIWAVDVDLTGSSTAALALVFYPIMIQGWAWLAAFVAVFVTSRWLGRKSDSP